VTEEKKRLNMKKTFAGNDRVLVVKREALKI